MQDYQAKYQEEKRKYDNLLKMQKTILADNDDFIAAFNLIRQAFAKLDNSTIDEQEEITAEEAYTLAQKTVEFIEKRQKACECERWRQLYQQECKDSSKLSREKQELMNRLIAKEKEQQLDRLEINKLLNDYLELFKKSLDQQQEKSDSKKKRSKSKGKNQSVQAQTERKQVKQTVQEEPGHTKMVLQKWQRDLTQLTEQIQTLRQTLIQKEQLIRLYRAKERKHLLAGGDILDI